MADIKCIICGYQNEDRTFVPLDAENHYICDDCINEIHDLLNPDDGHEKVQKKVEENARHRDLTPAQIREFLNDYVIGQEKAKKILAVAVYNHMKILDNYDKADADTVEIEKSNILMLGPSGSGKTHIVKTVAKLFDVPYAIADATTLTESGYVGADVESVLQKLITAANGDIKRAERGIIFIDEIDKKASKGQQNTSITRDVSGEGVQQALLKIIEGSVVDVFDDKRRNPLGATREIDTSKILFIVGGAFPGIEEIIKRRLNYRQQTSIGLDLGGKDNTFLSKDVEYNQVIDKVSPDDLHQYGMIPEFLGRLPIICSLHELQEEQLVQILTEPKNALLKQYQQLLSYDGVKLELEQEALQAIAHRAIANKTGARGLRAIMEEVLLDIMYAAPDRLKGSGTIVVSKDNVINHTEPTYISLQANCG